MGPAPGKTLAVLLPAGCVLPAESLKVAVPAGFLLEVKGNREQGEVAGGDVLCVCSQETQQAFLELRPAEFLSPGWFCSTRQAPALGEAALGARGFGEQTLAPEAYEETLKNMAGAQAKWLYDGYGYGERSSGTQFGRILSDAIAPTA